MRTFTPRGGDIDSVFDVRAILQQTIDEIDLPSVPGLLWPAKGRFGLRDWEKVFLRDTTAGSDIYDERRVDRDAGCVVVVRPDQFVAEVFPLSARDALTEFFAGFMIRPEQESPASAELAFAGREETR